MRLNVAVRYLKYTVTVISIELEEALAMVKSIYAESSSSVGARTIAVLLLLLEVDC